MFNNILIPIDTSPCHIDVVHTGLELARIHGSSVTFLCVIEDRSVEVYGRTYGKNLYVEYELAANELMQEVLRRAQAANVPAKTVLVTKKHPTDAILEAEEEHDLTVMGTHGRRGFKRFVLGSVTEEVLRQSTRPHLIVACKDNSRNT